MPVPQARKAPLAGAGLSLQNLEREFRQRQLSREVVELTIEKVMEVWHEYAAGVDSPSLRQFLQDAEVRIHGERLHVIVGTQMARGMIQQDTALMSALREKLQQPMLGMLLEVDTSRAPVRDTEESGPTSPREIYEHLAAKNPLLHDLRKRFDLSVD